MKNIAIILMDAGRHSEGLRMAAGLSLLDDKIDIYLLDKDFNAEDLPVIENYVGIIRTIGIGLYSNFRKDKFGFMHTADIGRKFAEYDYVIPY